MSVHWQDSVEETRALFPRKPPSRRKTLDGNLKRGPKVSPRQYGPTLPLGLFLPVSEGIAVTIPWHEMPTRERVTVDGMAVDDAVNPFDLTQRYPAYPGSGVTR